MSNFVADAAAEHLSVFAALVCAPLWLFERVCVCVWVCVCVHVSLSLPTSLSVCLLLCVCACVCVCAKFFCSLAGSAWRLTLSQVWTEPALLGMFGLLWLDARRCCAAVAGVAVAVGVAAMLVSFDFHQKPRDVGYINKRWEAIGSESLWILWSGCILVVPQTAPAKSAASNQQPTSAQQQQQQSARQQLATATATAATAQQQQQPDDQHWTRVGLVVCSSFV